jgi:hypothetical protein
MKYEDSKKLHRRKVGQSRKSQSIYDNLGHPYEIEKKFVIFIGKEEKSYCLTNGKEYQIIKANYSKFNYDKELAEKCKNKSDDNYDAVQKEDYFITIINDKGHKRKYSHLMFKLK